MPTIEEEIATKFEWSDKNVQKRLSQMERQVVDTYLKAYADIRSQVNVLYEKMKFKPDLYTASQYGRLKNIEMQIASILKQTGKKMNGNTESFIKEQFAERYYEAGYALESSLQMHLRFGLLNPKVITASVINPYDRIGWKKRTDMTNEQLNNIVRQSLTDSIIKGESYQTATAIIKSKIGQVVSNNIMRIVRTEGQRAMNWGNLTALSQAQIYAREAGIEFLKVWSATIDKRTRDSHRSMDGRHEEKTPEGGFILPSGVWTQAPSMSGVAEEDINCRCTLISQVDGMTPKFRRVRDEKGKSQVIPNQSYHQYFNARVKTQTSPISKPVTLKTKPVKPKAKPKKVVEKVKTDEFVPAKTKAGIQKWMEEREHTGVKKYVEREPNKPAYRFRGTYKLNRKTGLSTNISKYSLGSLDLKDAQKLQTLMNEADKICDLMDVPRLRGVVAPRSKDCMADMGDGIMGFNNRSVGSGSLKWKRPEQSLEEFIQKEVTKRRESFQAGGRPTLGMDYLAEHPDAWNKFTDNTFWHEFGHHIHQQLGVDNVVKYANPEMEQKIKVVVNNVKEKILVSERKLNDIIEKERKLFEQTQDQAHLDVIKNAQQAHQDVIKNYFPSYYSNHNSKEWFAENFALFMNGREDMLCEEFIQLLKDEKIYGVVKGFVKP